MRTAKQKISLAIAGIFGALPLAMGLIRALTTSDDHRLLWMAVVSTMFAAGVLAAAFGRRRSRQAVVSQSIVILAASAFLAAATGFLQGATSVTAVLLVAVAIGLSLAASSVFVAFSRPGAG